MKHITRYILLIWTLAVLLVSVTGCDVHEMPSEGEEPVPGNVHKVMLHLHFNRDCPIWQTITYNPETGTMSRSGQVQLRRYIIELHSTSSRSGSRTPINRWIQTRRLDEEHDIDVEIEIPNGHTYDVKVWSDYTDESVSDMYYVTEDFADMHLPDKNLYRGSEEGRDAFRGTVTLQPATASATIEMERPLAKYRFVTTDLQKFAESEYSRTYGVNTLSEPERSNALKALDLSAYGVRVIYPRYLPYSYNLFTDRPADSWSNVVFTTTIKRIDDTSAEIGFDYVFVNHHDTSTNVGIEVYDRRTNEVLARITPIDVPLRRSHVTEVRGPFLTTKASGSIGLNPDFDGEFNIFIQ